MTRSLPLSCVLLIAMAIGAFAQTAHSQPAPGNTRTGSQRTNAGVQQGNPPGGSQVGQPPAPAGGVPTSQPTTEPTLDDACHIFYVMEYLPEVRMGEFFGETRLPWRELASCNSEWPTAIHADSKHDSNRCFVEVRTQHPQEALCYVFTLNAQWTACDGKIIRVPLASKEVWHEDAGRGHQTGVVYKSLWVHEESFMERKKLKTMSFRWDQMPAGLQQALGMDVEKLGRTPAAGATVELDFRNHRKLTESPNGWYTVKVSIRENGQSRTLPECIMTSDFVKNSTPVRNAERSRNKTRFPIW